MSLYCEDIGFRSPRRKNTLTEPKTPISLQSNLKAIFARFDHENKGTIIAEDLFPILDLFEREQGVSLLDSEPKELLHKFCQKNRDLELSADDLHRLISQLSSPLNIRQNTMSPKISSAPRSHVGLNFAHPLSPLSSRKRTTPVISKTLSTRKVAATSLRRRSLSQSGFPSKLCFDKEERKLSPHFSNLPQSIIEEESCGSIFYGRNGSFNNSAESLDSPTQMKRDSNIKLPKSVYQYHDALESWRERSYEASSWISSTSEGENSFEGLIGEEIQIEVERDEVDDVLHINHLSKITVDLNKRLRQAERNLNLSVREHEDRISDLQNRIDEMHEELVMKKRDIQELKGHEKTHLSQISMLEAEIISVSRLLSHHKNLYADLKRQFEEKRVDNDKLQRQLRLKEEELAKVETDFHSFTSEQKKYQEERASYEKHIERLEHEVTFAQTLEIEVDGLREENQHLRKVVDHLRSDLNDAIKGTQTSLISAREAEMYNFPSNKNLHSELAPLLQMNPEQHETHSSFHDHTFERDQASKQCTPVLENSDNLLSLAGDSAHQWMYALEQIKQAKLSIKKERQALLVEIQRLRDSVNKPVSRKDMTVQCDLFPQKCLMVDSSVQHEHSNIEAQHTQINPTLAMNPEAHQQLVEDFNKLSNQFDAQKTIINELLTLNDNQSQGLCPIPSEQGVHSPAKDNNNSIRSRCANADTSKVQIYRFRIFKSIMLILIIFVLIIVSNFIYSNMMPSGFELNDVAFRNPHYSNEPLWTSQEVAMDELNSSDMSTFKFLTQWFDIFSDDHILVQIPT